MISSYLDHPSEEALERFLLHHAQEDELDRVETHILACDTCVARLEQLEFQIAAVKLALHELSQQPRTEHVAEKRSRTDWFTLRTLSWAGAAAVFAVAIALTPPLLTHAVPAADVTLSSNRGSEVAPVPQGRPLHLRLNAESVANGPVEVSLVSAYGSEIWKGNALARNDRVEVTIPKLDKSGFHFLRLYSRSADNRRGDLLREFSFTVK